MDNKDTDAQRDQFLAHFPTGISDRICDYVRDVVLLNSRYIFTNREKGLQYGYCTHCKKKYRTTGLKQNEKAKCRECKSECVVKQSGLGRKYLVDSAHVVFYEKSIVNPAAVIARSMYVQRDYRGDYLRVETLFSPQSMYLFEMGNSQMYRSYWRGGKWERVNTIQTDFSYSYTGGYRSTCPTEWIKEAIAGTPFQYSTWETYDYGDNVRFFDLYSRYPCIEYLTKLKMSYFVSAKLDRGRTYGAIDWNGKTLNKVLRMDRQRAKEFLAWIGNKANPLTLRLFQLAIKEKSGYTLDELDNLADKYDHECWSLFQKILKQSSLRRSDGYISRQMRIEKREHRPARAYDVLKVWIDYMADCASLGFDLNDESTLFPPRLHSAHQNTITQVKVKEDEELNRQIREKAKVRAKYQFESNGFMIRAAVDSKELIDEGKMLHHCVGTYANRYASGKIDIE